MKKKMLEFQYPSTAISIDNNSN